MDLIEAINHSFHQNKPSLKPRFPQLKFDDTKNQKLIKRK